jgi:hypothetical protein
VSHKNLILIKRMKSVLCFLFKNVLNKKNYYRF